MASASQRHAAEPRLGSFGQAFTPTQPRSGRRRLVGRQAELASILEALREDRAHVVLYSERGRGKTSLTNLVVESLRRTGYVVARHTCEAGTTFDGLIRGLLSDLPRSLLAAPVAPGVEWRSTTDMSGAAPLTSRGAEGDAGCSAALPARTLRPHDVVTLPQRLACRGLICVVDEFDRVADSGTRTLLADAIKQLSDGTAPLLFLIVGVSKNLDEILGQHPSIQRAVRGVHLPLFTDREIAEIIESGARESGLLFPAHIVAHIAALARGMPHIAQLLGLRCVQAACAAGRSAVSDENFALALQRVVNDISPQVVSLYGDLTGHGRDVETITALRRIATAEQDAWGSIIIEPCADGGVVVGDRAISAPIWQKLRESEAVQPIPTRADLYGVGNRGLIQYALLIAMRDFVENKLGEGAKSGASMEAREEAERPLSSAPVTRKEPSFRSVGAPVAGGLPSKDMPSAFSFDHQPDWTCQ